MKPCLLFLTCANKIESKKIILTLLGKKLITCVKSFPIDSSYLWKNKIESAQEVLLIMDSIEENFKKIDTEIKKIHSYKTYNLLMVEIKKMNDKALKWLQNSI